MIRANKLCVHLEITNIVACAAGAARLLKRTGISYVDAAYSISLCIIHMLIV